MASFVFISEKNRERYLKIVGPVGNLFAKTGIHPNVLSVTGLVLSLAAGVLYSQGIFFWAAWVVVLAGTCDTLDGQIARRNNKHSRFGAFFDSTVDRYSDLFLYIGLAYYFAGGRSLMQSPEPVSSVGSQPWTVTVIILAIAGSYMVSYARARGEGLGVECTAGMMQRPERITLLIVGSLLGAIPVAGTLLLKLTLIALAVSTNITAIHRILFIKERLLKEDQAE